jgi:hypothetical protein
MKVPLKVAMFWIHSPVFAARKARRRAFPKSPSKAIIPAILENRGTKLFRKSLGAQK